MRMKKFHIIPQQPKIPWKEFKVSSRVKWGTDSITSCYVGKCYHVLKVRNSYNASVSLTYDCGASIHPSLAEAVKYANLIRAKGTSFEVRQIPCLCIQSEKDAINIIDTWYNFTHHSSLKLLRIKLINMADDIASDLNLWDRNHIYLYKTKASYTEPVTNKFIYYKSSIYNNNLFFYEVNESPIDCLEGLFELQKKVWGRILKK